MTGFRGGFGLSSGVYRQLWFCILSELWEDIMAAPNQNGAVHIHMQMIDSTVVRAHHPWSCKVLRTECPEGRAAGATAGHRNSASDVPEEVLRLIAFS